jgi:antitoxin (DNA-binding transcriptional repressor) of toxin-antitoxin stability system
MITVRAKHTTKMSVTQARKQWFQLLGMIEETGLVVLLTHHGQQKFALVPFQAAQGAGIGIRKRGRAVAALVRLVE